MFLLVQLDILPSLRCSCWSWWWRRGPHPQPRAAEDKRNWLRVSNRRRCVCDNWVSQMHLRRNDNLSFICLFFFFVKEEVFNRGSTWLSFHHGSRGSEDGSHGFFDRCGWLTDGLRLAVKRHTEDLIWAASGCCSSCRDFFFVASYLIDHLLRTCAGYFQLNEPHLCYFLLRYLNSAQKDRKQCSPSSPTLHPGCGGAGALYRDSAGCNYRDVMTPPLTWSVLKCDRIRNVRQVNEFILDSKSAEHEKWRG